MQSVPPESDDTDYELLEAQVPVELAGKRFDQVLAEMFPEFSRSRLTEWIKAGSALLDGQQVKPRDPVRGGETGHPEREDRGRDRRPRPRTSRSTWSTRTRTCW